MIPHDDIKHVAAESAAVAFESPAIILALKKPRGRVGIFVERTTESLHTMDARTRVGERPLDKGAVDPCVLDIDRIRHFHAAALG